MATDDIKEVIAIPLGYEEVTAIPLGYEEVTAIPLRKKTKGTTEKKRTCCGLALDIISCIFLFLMAIFFIVGTSQLWLYYGYIIFPRSTQACLIVGSIFYILTLSIEIFKRKSEGALAISMASVELFGALCWLIAPCIIRIAYAFSSAFLVGSVSVLTSMIYNLAILYKRRGGGVSVFTMVGWTLILLANSFFIASTIMGFGVGGGFNAYRGLYVSGSVFYFIAVIFYTLGLFLPQRCCKLGISN